MKIINPFTNISYNPLPVPTNEQGGSTFLSNLKTASVGSGIKTFKIDKSGLWLGAEKFSDAPFSVDMNGNLKIIGGYIKVGGAGTDVNNGSTIISGGKIEVSGSSTFASGYNPATKLAISSTGALAYKDLVEKAELGTTVISGGYINASLLTASNIVTGTLNASIIAANSITASKLNITDLSAISANIGTVNAGTLTGVDIHAIGNSIAFPAIDFYTNGNDYNASNPTGGIYAWLLSPNRFFVIYGKDGIIIQSQTAGAVTNLNDNITLGSDTTKTVKVLGKFKLPVGTNLY